MTWNQKTFKFALAVLLLLGISEPAYAHGADVSRIIGAHIFAMAFGVIFLLYYPARLRLKTIAFGVLMLAIIAIWCVPILFAVCAILATYTVVGFLLCVTIPTAIGVIAFILIMAISGDGAKK